MGALLLLLAATASDATSVVFGCNVAIGKNRIRGSRGHHQGSDKMADLQVVLGLPELRKGANPGSGPTVVEHLQLMLNQRGGFPVLNEDGDFGSNTEASVKHYQQNENLTVDGVVGKQTWTSLLSKWLLQSEPG